MSNRQIKAPGQIGDLGRGSQIINNVVPAGSSVPFPATGNTFYLLAASAPLQIRPSGGSFAEYRTGTGLDIVGENAFSQLELKNTTANPISFSLFVGFDGFIDNRVIVAGDISQQVAYPTYKQASTAAAVAINDLSGQKFTDVNGGQWYALNRVAIIVSNIDSGVTLLLQKAGSSTASGDSICGIFPLTSLNYPVSGNYSLSVGGGMINAIVSEIYNAIPAT